MADKFLSPQKSNSGERIFIAKKANSEDVKVEWGSITGTLADQTDLNTALGAAGYKISCTQSQTGYVYTFNLLDKNDNVISTFNIDFPLEEMIVDVEYDNENERFILTLKDGTKKYIPASGILKGLVTENATQTITNKTINATNNNISNLRIDNFNSETISTSISSSSTATQIPTAKAVADLAQEWIFTLEDDTTVTKKVVILP